MAKTEAVEAATLVMDFNLYPRNRLNESHVRDIAEARASGAVMPAVVAERESRRVVDGFHRINDVLRNDGPTGTILVEWRDYPSEAELLADAISLNSTHGYRLTAQDHTRIVHLAKGFGLELERVSTLLHVRAEELEKRGRHIAILTTPGKRTLRGQEVIPLKRTFRNLEGKSITAEMAAANSKVIGNPQSFLIGQVIIILESGAVDLEKPLVVERLKKLRELLAEIKLPGD
jgi:hypothetical protein